VPLLVLLFSVAVPMHAAAQAGAAAMCREWAECRRLALEAADEGNYERFHDLAWRAVQTGPSRDPALMFLLARAQVLSGRPHDALVMLQRLAGMGYANDAATNPEFERTRELPGWPEVEALIARAGRPDTAATAGASTSPRTPAPPRSARSEVIVPPAPPAAAAASPPASPALPAAAPPPVSAAVPVLKLPGDNAVRFSAERFAAGGLAYDGVSQRFVIGDSLSKKLMVVGVGADHAIDLVRAESAGFRDVAALEIDERRGDLWVAGGADGDGALHRLQLVSGRPLKTYRTAAAVGQSALTDLAIMPSGTVVALDAAQGRLLTLASGETTLDVAMALKLRSVETLAAAGDEGIVFVAHADGISRVDLRSRTIARVTAGRGIDLRHVRRVRAYRDGLVALQTRDDGRQQVVRLSLNPGGRRVARSTIIDPAVAAPAGRLFLAISNDEVYYLASAAATAAGAPPLPEFLIRRVPLR
jgi:hypothetical protein